MSSTINYPFTNSSNYTFDNNLIEISAGIAKLKDLGAPADVTAWMTFTVDQNLNYFGGSNVGTLYGFASVSGGYLDLAGAALKYCDWGALDNFDFQQEGAFKKVIKPDYSGNPTTTQNFIVVSKASGDSDNFINLYQKTNGNLTVIINDLNGVTRLNVDLGIWNPTATQEYEFELNVDLDTTVAGDTYVRLFIDGTQFGATQTGFTCTRDANIGLYRTGTNLGIGDVANYSVKDSVCFDAVQHVTDYTPGYILPESKYSKDNPTIVVNSTFRASDWLTFAETLTKTGSDEIKYCPRMNSQDRWFSGTAQDSDGTYSQSNTATEVNTNAESYITTRAVTGLKIFLHSDTGNTTPELDIVTITYDSVLEDPSTSTLIELEGFIYTPLGAEENVELKIRPYVNGYVNVGVFMAYQYESMGFTNSAGWIDADIYVNPSDKYYDFKIGKQSYKVDMSGLSGLVDIKDLTFEVIPEVD